MKIWMLVQMFVAALALAMVLAELILRVGFGFGDPPLYIGDDRIGYLLAPNQRVKRFGNRICINEYSMRADAITPQPRTGTLRLLLLGDSLANGSWWTDQSDILSMRIAYYLRDRLPNDYGQVETLNASANSWGPRNQMAYLERYGTFGSAVLVLLLNTDDLFGTQPTPLQVGRDRSYPDRKPLLAIAEILSRYLQANQSIPGLKEIQSEGGDRVGKNLAAIDRIHQQINADGGQFILVLSPLKRELPGPRDYELVARKRLTEWATNADIPYLDLLEAYQHHPEPDSLYRDHIHLSSLGNELVAEAIAKMVATTFTAP
ncbi:MAG: SGNH/GDSL hydrolase family protein [Phormidesmis sp. RL_2_1]|nr:SGNH/GDSL hydrolase family protein [Phormidesmis sp. RL_2_1]